MLDCACYITKVSTDKKDYVTDEWTNINQEKSTQSKLATESKAACVDLWWHVTFSGNIQMTEMFIGDKQQTHDSYW